MIDTATRVTFLKQSHLFQGANDRDLASVAEILREVAYDEETTIFAENTPADSFYMIYRGQVRLTRRTKERSAKVASLFPGDYFGERGLIKGTFRNAAAKAEPGTLLLILYRDEFKRLLSRLPHLWKNFDLMMNSRQLASSLNFAWLGENEVIYFLTRKHYVVLLRMLAWPVLGMLFMAGVIGLGLTLETGLFGSSLGPAIAGVGGFLFVLTLAWAAWQYLDWGNDFYIVTNQRVVFLTKVIGLYDNRQEAPMSTILSINTESTYWGRNLFDYGTVIVRTFVGQIRMSYVRHPMQAAAMIEEYWNRTKQVTRKTDEELIRNTIRGKLGLKNSAPVVAPAPAPTPLRTQEGFIQRSWRELFTLRREDGGTVTYHKHWFVLIRDTFLQGSLILLTIATLIAYPILAEPVHIWLIFLLFVAFIGLVLWWLYGYLDWQNDVYQVTPEQIVDVYKKPLGMQDRKAAPLESILSTEYRRNNLIEVLLNYGTVYITVGGAHFDFDDVADPPAVQQDIVRRLQVRLAKKKETDSAAERDRLAEWMAHYHGIIQEIIEEERKQGSNDLGYN